MRIWLPFSTASVISNLLYLWQLSTSSLRSMLSSFTSLSRLSSLLICLFCSGAVCAQSPTITGIMPLANATAASRTGAVTVSFTQPLIGGSASALKVFSKQHGGLRTAATPAVTNANTLSFSPPPARPFMPGETVFGTVTTAASSTTGPLPRARAFQFTTAVGGTGAGRFLMPTIVANGTLNMGSAYITGMVSGDVDGDGDLDLLVGTWRNTIHIRLNDGRGIFTTPATGATLTINNARLLTLGDMDGDGDLDLITGSTDANGNASVSLSLNNGNGSFTPPTYYYTVGGISSIVLGDLDGNGTLDLAVTRSGQSNNVVSIGLNNGSGIFSGLYNSLSLQIPYFNPVALALGDVDSDGDLDLVTANNLRSSGVDGLNICLNDGFGNFTASSSFIPLIAPDSVLLGDIDGDNDLDLLSKWGGGYTGVFFNNGVGGYTVQPSNTALLFSNLESLTLGDVDADGDLDLLALSGTPHTNTNNGIVNERLNNGLGNFTMPPTASQAASVQVDKYPSDLAMVDVDGDGDLDVVTSGGIDVFYGGNAATVSVRLNGGIVLATATPRPFTYMSLHPNPATREFRVFGAPIGVPLEVIDVMGRRVAITEVVTRETTAVLMPAGLAAGVYIVRSGAQSQRLTLQ